MKVIASQSTALVERPNLDLVDEAHAKHQRLLALGVEKARLNQEQLGILFWMHNTPGAVQALNFDSIYEYATRDPEAVKALWGVTPQEMSTTTVNRYLRFLEMQMKVGSDVNIFEIKHSVAAAGGLPEIEAAVDALPAIDSPKRAEAVEALKELIEDSNSRSYREGRAHATQGRQPAWSMDEKAGIVYYQPLRGQKVAVLKLNPRAGLLAAEVVHRLVHPVAVFKMDQDALTAWQGDTQTDVAQILTSNRRILDLIADEVHALRK